MKSDHESRIAQRAGRRGKRMVRYRHHCGWMEIPTMRGRDFPTRILSVPASVSVQIGWDGYQKDRRSLPSVFKKWKKKLFCFPIISLFGIKTLPSSGFNSQMFYSRRHQSVLFSEPKKNHRNFRIKKFFFNTINLDGSIFSRSSMNAPYFIASSWIKKKKAARQCGATLSKALFTMAIQHAYNASTHFYSSSSSSRYNNTIWSVRHIVRCRERRDWDQNPPDFQRCARRPRYL